MNFELVEIPELSGKECKIYSVRVGDDQETLFEQFVSRYYPDLPDEVQDIYDRLNVIGHEVGAREVFFKHNEGTPGDGVCALYDIPGSKLRLYCIRYDKVAIVLGDGGLKPKTIRSWQQSKELSRCAKLMICLSLRITQLIRAKEMTITDNGIIGEMKIGDDDE